MLREIIRAFLLQEGADGQLIAHILLLGIVVSLVMGAGLLLVLRMRALFAQLADGLTG